MTTAWRAASAAEFRFRGGRVSLDLCSTLLWRHVEPLEQLRTADDLERWLLEAGVAAPRVTASAADVAQARLLRETLYRSFLARLHGSRPSRHSVGVINRFAAAAVGRPRLTTDCRRTWHAEEPVAAALAAIAWDGIDLLAGRLSDRVRECAAPDCAFLFLDTSRGRNRRWCAMSRCGNREHVRAHRRRRR